MADERESVFDQFRMTDAIGSGVLARASGIEMEIFLFPTGIRSLGNDLEWSSGKLIG